MCLLNKHWREQGGKSLLHAEGKRGITYEWLHAWLPDSMNESPRIRLCSLNEHENCSDFQLQSLIINIVYSTRQGRKPPSDPVNVFFFQGWSRWIIAVLSPPRSPVGIQSFWFQQRKHFKPGWGSLTWWVASYTHSLNRAEPSGNNYTINYLLYYRVLKSRNVF